MFFDSVGLVDDQIICVNSQPLKATGSEKYGCSVEIAESLSQTRWSHKSFLPRAAYVAFTTHAEHFL